MVQHPVSAPNVSRARSRDDFPGLYAVSLPARPFMGARPLPEHCTCHQGVPKNMMYSITRQDTLGSSICWSAHAHHQEGGTPGCR